MTKMKINFSQAVIAAVTLASAISAHAICTDGTPWSGAIPMPVVINDLISSDLCPGSSCSSFDDVRWTAQKTLTEWYRGSGSKFRMSYEGPVTAARGQIIEGKVHIFANNCSGGVLGLAAWNTQRTWGKIRMCIANGGGTIDWQTDALDRTGRQFSFQNVLMAELAHIVGMKHGEDCPDPTVKTVSSGDYERDMSHLFGGDIDWLQDVFGYRSANGVARTSATGLTWTQGFADPIANTPILGVMSASNGAAGANTFITYTDAQYRTISLSRYNSSAWMYVSSLPFATSHYQTAVASASDQIVHAYFAGGYAMPTGMQNIYDFGFANGGTTLSSATVLSDDASESRTTSNGVGASHDPATGQYIATWRGAFNNGGSITHVNEIFYKVGSHPVQRLVNASGVPYLASDTPSIACGSTSVVGTQNCLFAWSDGRSWHRVVRWFQASVDGNGILVPSSLKTHNYVSLGTPSVAYRRDPTYPWMIALSQGGTTTYTWRKGPNATHAFVDQRSVVTPPYAVGPALGSRISSSSRLAVMLNVREGREGGSPTPPLDVCQAGEHCCEPGPGGKGCLLCISPGQSCP